jgi:RNA polymerase sigma factor (sigma-70 family)
MIDLTAQQIADAKAKDIDAVTAVVRATEERVLQLAAKYATTGGKFDRDLSEDLAQQGRIAVWESINRFAGTDVAQFFTFIDKTLKGLMSDARRAETRQGVSAATAARFERALSKADGDKYKAEELVAQEDVMGKHKLSPEMAYAARLAYEGVEYLNAPMWCAGTHSQGEYEAFTHTIGQKLADEHAVPADLEEPSDIDQDRRKATARRVHRTLAQMGEQQRVVLSAMTGIDPVGDYGTDHDDELAADYELPRKSISSIRKRGIDRFRSLYVGPENF